MKNVFKLGVLNFWKLSSKPAHGMRDRALRFTSISYTERSKWERLISFVISFRITQSPFFMKAQI